MVTLPRPEQFGIKSTVPLGTSKSSAFKAVRKRKSARLGGKSTPLVVPSLETLKDVRIPLPKPPKKEEKKEAPKPKLKSVPAKKPAAKPKVAP